MDLKYRRLLGLSLTLISFAKLGCSVATETVTPVIINPTSATLPFGTNQQFQALDGTPDFTFSVDSGGAGSIDPITGLYTRPWRSVDTTVRVTDSRGSTATAAVTLSPTILRWGAGGSSKLTAHSIATDSNGNLFVLSQATAGISTAIAPEIGVSNSAAEMIIQKFSPLGVLQWTKQIGAGETDTIASGLALDSSGNIFISGGTLGISNFATQAGLTTSAGINQLLLVKLSPDATLQWARRFGAGGGNYYYYNRIAVDSAGNPYATGSFQTGTSGFELGIASAGYRELAIIKWNTTGGVTWTRQMGTGSTSSIDGYFASFDSNSDLTITGMINGQATLGTQLNPPNSNTNIWELFVTKIIPTPAPTSVAFLNRMSGSATEHVNITGTAQDSSGNIYVSSFINSTTLGPAIGTLGTTNILITKFNAAGGLVWNRLLGAGAGSFSYGAGSNNYGNSGSGVAADVQGNIYVVGHTNGSIGTEVGTTTTGYKSFIAKINSAGELQWARQIGGGSNSNTDSSQVTLDSSGRIFLLGFTTSKTLGTQIGTASTGQEIFMAQFDSEGNLQ